MNKIYGKKCVCKKEKNCAKQQKKNSIKKTFQ